MNEVSLSPLFQLPILIQKAKWWIFAICLFSIFGAVALHRAYPRYRASASLYVKSNSVSPLMSTLSRVSSMGISPYVQEDDVDRYLKTLSSEDFFKDLVAQLELYLNHGDLHGIRASLNFTSNPELMSVLLGQTSFRKGASDLLEITVSDTDDISAYRATNLMADLVRSSLISFEAKELREAEKYLEEELSNSRSRINGLFAEIDEIQNKTKLKTIQKRGIISVPGHLEKVENEYQDIGLKLSQVKGLIRLSNRKMKAQISNRKREDVRGFVIDRLRDLERQRETLFAKHESLRFRLSKLYASNTDLQAQKKFEFEKSLETELEIQKNLRRNIFESKVQRISLKSKITQYSVASLDGVRPVASLGSKILISSIGALGLVGMLLFLIAHYAPLIVSKEQIASSGAKWLANIPESEEKSSLMSRLRTRILGDKLAKVEFKMAFQYLRVRLQQAINSREPEGSKVIGVVSSKPNEGKSTVAFNLALAYAQSGTKALLVDCDFMKVPHVREGEGDVGFLDFLHGEATFEQVVLKGVGSNNLDIVTAGNDDAIMSSNEHEGLLQEFFQKARSEYEVIIVDTIAFSAASQAIWMVEHADIPLVVVRSRQSRLSEYGNLLEAVVGFRNRSVYVVLNRHNESHFSEYPTYSVGSDLVEKQKEAS